MGLVPPSGKQLAFIGKYADPPAELRDVDVLFFIHVDVAWPQEVDPRVEEVSLGVEYLDSAVLPVGYPYPVLFIDPEVVWQPELAWCSTWLAPGHYQLALRAELVDPGVPVPVTDEDIAV